MLTRLQVKNFVLIDSLDITFPEGLIIITGQTGAGKSIILGALSLVLGGRADVSSIGDSSDNCVVEAEFEMGDAQSLREIIEQNDLDWDSGHLVLRRVVSSNGRSRCFINDEPSSLPVLTSISSHLLDIHSQHQTLLLSDRSFQLDMLDRYAGNMELRRDCSDAYSSLSTICSEIADIEARIIAADRDRDWNESQLSQLEAAKLVDGELEILEAEQQRLANAEEIKLLLCESLNLADNGTGESISIGNALKEIHKRLTRLSRYLPESSDLAARVESSRIELEDVFSEVQSMNESVDDSSDRLVFVEDRLSLLYSLMKKHSCSDIPSLIALRNSLSSGLQDCTDLRDRKSELEKEKQSAQEKLNAICARLHDARARASIFFASDIQKSARSLEMPQAVFQVSLLPSPASSTGTDRIQFDFSANGRSPEDISKCASGGEMSRIMLSLKDMMARFADMPTMLFDEIDTGVSGSVADKMGSMICGMGQFMQVFAITHLPQVAAKGKAHYLVEKHQQGERTVTTIEKLSAEQRVYELARMLSGSSLTQASIDNAKSLLGY